MQTNQHVTEIVGKPGKVWGKVFIPARGTITVRIAGDLLHSMIRSGFEQSDDWTRIQNIDHISLAEAPNYALLSLGLFLTLLGLLGLLPLLLFSTPYISFRELLLLGAGIAIIVYTLKHKQRLLIINSLRNTIPIFITSSPDAYKRFASTVMTVARQLGAAPSVSPRPSRPNLAANGHTLQVKE